MFNVCSGVFIWNYSKNTVQSLAKAFFNALYLLPPLAFLLHRNCSSKTQTDHDQPPLYALIDGDIYSFTTTTGGQPFRETNWGHNHPPVVSPDGRYIAYGSLPQLLVTLDATGEYPINYDQHPPTNIWMMDTATHDFTLIADQPEQNRGGRTPLQQALGSGLVAGQP